MKVTASIDGFSLLASGTALLANSELKLQVEELPICISFKSDSGTPRWETEGSEESGVLFKLFNMTRSTGEGVFTPISIAKSDDTEFFLSFYVTSLNGGSQRALVYNVLQKRDGS